MYRERFSILKSMQESPAHYWHARHNPFEQTAAMRLGSLVHAMVLGGVWHAFEGDARRGKDWDWFRKQFPSDALLVTAPEVQRATEIANAVRSDKRAAPLLCDDSLVREQTIEWEYDGRPWRSTPDAVGRDFVADLKTTTCAAPELFAYHARRMRYVPQMSCYDLATGGRGRDLYLVAVEVAAPYGVTVFRLTDAARDQGRATLALWHSRVKQCEEEGVWPGYAQGVIDLDADEEAPELVFPEGDE